ncbi:hypothetical protein SK128_023935 [Halocaridina rubra]|uniref:Uncharacterized protein n=1 Tax=Halocaridina rubra TaxID=373956 RepID=A0AAN8WVE4_HALRR
MCLINISGLYICTLNSNSTEDPWQAEAWNSSRKLDFSEISTRPVAHWVLVGDSHIRYIFEVLVQRLQYAGVKYRVASFRKEKWEDPKTMLKQKREIIHEDYHEVIHPYIPLKITYRWEATLQHLPKSLKLWISGREPRPAVLLFGTALHFMKNSHQVYLQQGQEKAAENFTQHLQFLSPHLHRFAKVTPTVYKLQDHLQV